MQFFNIRAQVVSLLLPDARPGARDAITLDFRQHPTDAMLQELRITEPGSGGRTAILVFQKAGGNTEIRWEGTGAAAGRDPDAVQIDQAQADELKLKPGQKTVDSGGRLIQAPGAVPVQPQADQSDGPGMAPNAAPPANALDQPFTAENPGVPDSSQDPNPPDQQAPATLPPGDAVNTTESMRAKPPRTR